MNYRLFFGALFCMIFVSCGGKPGDTDTGTPPQETSVSPDNVESLDTPTTVDNPVSQETQNTGLLPLIDAHAHQMPKDYPDGWLETLFAENAPMGIALLGIGNVSQHQENYPNQVFAFSNFKDLDIDLTQVDDHLKAGFYGIGEVSIRHFGTGAPGNKSPDVDNPFNEPILIELYDLAREHSVPILFHYDYESDHMDEMTLTLPEYLDVIFIWAHSGDAQPLELRSLMEAHDNLHLDISSRNPLESFEGRLTSKELQRLDEEDGTIKTEWRELFTDFADRIYYGSDIGPKGRLEEYAAIQEYYRGILGQLDPEVAEKIAYKNAQVLFGLSGP